MALLKDPLTRDEYTTVIFVMAVMSGFYHAAMGLLGLFAWSGRETLADWLLLLSGFFLPLAIALFARRRRVAVGWILLVGSAILPMALLPFIAGSAENGDLARGFFWRFAAPSGLIGGLFLAGGLFPERRSAEEL